MFLDGETTAPHSLSDSKSGWWTKTCRREWEKGWFWLDFFFEL